MKQGDIILILQKKNSSVIVKKWGLAPFIVIAGIILKKWSCFLYTLIMTI